MGGSTVTANEEYLRESIKLPNEKIVEGYSIGAMPKVFFNDAEIRAMVKYISSSGLGPLGEPGAYDPFQAKLPEVGIVRSDF